MANKQTTKTEPDHKAYEISVLSRDIRILTDRAMMFDILSNIRDRMWGVVGLIGFMAGMLICSAIRPDILTIDGAFSHFGEDVRTAPFFVLSIFFASYGFWRWRRYLESTFNRPGIITGMLTLAILGLYTVALMPIAAGGAVEQAHYLGFGVAGIAMAAMVVFDVLSRKTADTSDKWFWRSIRIIAAGLIIAGIIITFLSFQRFDLFDLTLVGELLMLFGFFVWVVIKTYSAEGAPSKLSDMIKQAVTVQR